MFMCGVVVRTSAASEERREGEDDTDSEEVGSLVALAPAGVASGCVVGWWGVERPR